MKRLLSVTLLLIIVAFAAFAQADDPFATLEYFDDPDGVFITSSDGEDLFPEYGMELLPGDSIETTTSVAEIRLDPNGSLIKLATNTNFTIDTLQDRGGAEANTFSLVAGKLRAIAARSGTEAYQIKTQTAVAGVRGTTLGLETQEGVTDKAVVEKGEIDFQNISSRETIQLLAGQAADTFADVFEAVALTAEELADFFEGIAEFVGENIDEGLVPGNEPEVTEEAPPEDEAPATVETPTVPEETTEDEAAAEEAAAEPSITDPIIEWLREVLGMEMGTITIDGITYSKAILQPQFQTDGFGIALYLPIIYETNMFDPENWHHPKGNNEWSFGFDPEYQDDFLGGFLDFLSDLALKIRYITIGSQRDPFYLNVGNLSNMTIGHGILMRNFANDSDFPAVRSIGINMGFDLGVFGMETVVNDLAEPEIFVARMYLRPFDPDFRLAIGIAGIADIDPAGEFPLEDTDIEPTEPIFLGASFDLDLPFIESEPFSIVAFADVAGMLPYFRSEISDEDTIIEEGFYGPALIIPEDELVEGELPFRNYGFSAGLFGNIFIADYRFDFRHYTGTFRPTFFNTNYERLRPGYVSQLKNELLNPTIIEPITGIYGELGFNILDKFRFEAGYLWPWTIDENGDLNPADEDQLHLEIVLEKGTIPVVDIHGSIKYDRTKFIPTLLGGDTDLQIFDANTVMSAEVVYPVAPTLDLAILVTTTVTRDEDGNILDTAGEILDILDDLSEVLPGVSFSVSIETRVHF